jgi:hypothetical protein
MPLISGGPPQVNYTQVNDFRAEVARYEASRDAINAQLAVTRTNLANRSWYEWYDRNSEQRQIAQLQDNLQSTFGHLRAAQENLQKSLAGNAEQLSMFQPSSGTVSVAGAFGSGLKTGGKAVGNAAGSSLTLGFYDGPFTVTQQDIDNGYNASRAIAGISTEILVGVGTGGLATYTKAGTAARVVSKTALAFDTGGNVVNVGRGVSDAYQNGIGFGNSLQIIGSGLGLSGNAAAGGRALGEIANDASRVRVSFDPATVSAGGLGGVKVHLNKNQAFGNFGVYDLNVNGALYKVGKVDLDRVTQSSGLPTRVHQQVRELRKVFGEVNVQPGQITPLGRTTTASAKLAETARI